MLFPLAAALVQPAFKDFESLRLDAAGAHAALLLRCDEMAILEELHMLDDGGERHIQRQCDLAYGFRA